MTKNVFVEIYLWVYYEKWWVGCTTKIEGILSVRLKATWFDGYMLRPDLNLVIRYKRSVAM